MKLQKYYRWPPRTVRNVASLQNDRSYYDIETLIRNRLKAAPQLIQRLDLDGKLEGHTGCVNCLEWSSNGRLLASGSDDNRIIIWNAFKQQQVLDLLTPHHGNIFSVKFLPNTGDALIVSGAADHNIYVFDINRTAELTTPCWKCNCHSERVKRLATVAECPYLFWSAGEDGRVLQFDIRESHQCTRDDKVCLINLQNHLGPSAEAKCVTVNNRKSEQIAVGGSDAYARVYDRRMIKLTQVGGIALSSSEQQIEDNLAKNCVTYYCPGHLNKVKDQKSSFAAKTITYLTFSPDGYELLVNMGSEQIYIYDLLNAQQPVYLSMPQFNKSIDNTVNASLNANDDVTMQIESASITNEMPSTSSTAFASEISMTTTKFTKSSKLPQHVEEIKRAGNDFMENEKYLQAINQYSECIKLMPDHPIFYLNRATAYMRRNWFGDMYAGLRDCQHALRLDPTYVKAHFRLARALFELDFVIEASECLNELKERFPNDANSKQIQLLSQEIGSHVSFQLENRSPIVNTEHVNLELSETELYWRTGAKDYAERFVGHCNTTTDIKEANYFGSDGSYVIAGSDDGNFYIWERPTNKIVSVYKADTTILNCVQPHPYICLLATSGIDHEIRLWSPKPDDHKSESRVEYFDTMVTTNQQQMQTDPFEFNPTGANCRTS